MSFHVINTLIARILMNIISTVRLEEARKKPDNFEELESIGKELATLETYTKKKKVRELALIGIYVFSTVARHNNTNNNGVAICCLRLQEIYDQNSRLASINERNKSKNIAMDMQVCLWPTSF